MKATKVIGGYEVVFTTSLSATTKLVDVRVVGGGCGPTGTWTNAWRLAHELVGYAIEAREAAARRAAEKEASRLARVEKHQAKQRRRSSLESAKAIAARRGLAAEHLAVAGPVAVPKEPTVPTSHYEVDAMNDSPHLHYIVMNRSRSERITRADCDSTEQAFIIERTLLPVLQTGIGWADSRKSAYRVRGEVTRARGQFVLTEHSVPVATLYVCLDAKAATGVWRSVIEESRGQLGDAALAPAVPWALLRHDAPADVPLPQWLDWWARHVGYALLTREGW
ncbi:hypothetical protein [Burkholderia gladioli]|uniref:hypothetical protein n=1 Tax=Burkholderia gladioli TaxID=28095 RepID=UPI0016407CED|nr:hypothetical protein [Burkholderia gladioli]